MQLSPLALNPALMDQAKKVPDIDMKRIEETARDFEAMFMTEMLKPMFEGLEVDSTFGGGKGEEVFRGFLLEEYGKNMAATGSLGIADMVKEQLIQMQSDASAPKLAQNMHSDNTDVTGDENNAS